MNKPPRAKARGILLRTVTASPCHLCFASSPRQDAGYSLSCNKNDYFECDIAVQSINGEGDILDIFGKLYPKRKLLIYQENLNPDFFDLSTGLAGSILQKLVNYRVVTAFVVDVSTIKSVKFKEMVNEANMGYDFRFFDTKESAVRAFSF